MPTKKDAKPAAAKKPAKPRPTAAERRAQREAEREALLKEQAAKEAEFEKNRATIWQGLWARALRLELLVRDHTDIREQSTHDWWFADFSVNAVEQSFDLEGQYRPVSCETLKYLEVDRIERSLETGLEYVNDYLAEKERLRLEAEEQARRRQVALAKLDDEDKKALGLRY
jgi:hypothetical protein